MPSFHLQDVKCKTPTHSQLTSSILIPGKRQKLLLWPQERWLWRMPGQDLFGSVGSHQHHGRNPDWGPRRETDSPSQRKLNGPKWAPAVPLDLMIRRCEESSSISYNLNKVLKTMYTYYSHWKTFASKKELVWGESCYNNSLPFFSGVLSQTHSGSL